MELSIHGNLVDTTWSGIPKTPRVAIAANIGWHLHNFRKSLIEAVEARGMQVVLLAAPDEYTERLSGPDRIVLPLTKLKRTGLNPAHDLELYREILGHYREYEVDAAIHYTSKANIYGGLASMRLGIPSIHTINGLGGPFSGGRMLAPIAISFLYRIALRRSRYVFFQNQHDRTYFTDRRIIRAGQGHVVDGSGVDVQKFKPALKARSGSFTCLLFSRLSKTKGILEYVEAARILRAGGADFTFRLAGRHDADEFAILQSDIDGWQSEGLIEFLGNSDDIAREIGRADAVVYPSYYMEGIPRALLEALAMGMPIITSDHVGCCETVLHGENGFLVPKKDPRALAKAIEDMAGLSPDRLAEMGRRSRKLAEVRFNDRKVNDSYLDALADVMSHQTKLE